MQQQQRQPFEYHITILNVKMKVKFPCRMKIEHQGSLLTGENAPSQDNRYIFNQNVTLKDHTKKQCFDLTVNLLTDKGAKYIAGIVKLYHSEMVRSEGQKLSLSLAKCIDTQAFCEIKVDQIFGLSAPKNIPYDRKSALQREVPYRHKDLLDVDVSPRSRSPINGRPLESRSQYQFPLHDNTREVRQDWDTKSKSRYMPQTVYQKSRITPQKISYTANHPQQFGHFQMDAASVGRQKLLQAEVYKQGYQKLKQKYRKETQLSKQELNKRLALENNENNLKLQIMRLKMKVQENQKSLADKNAKLKQLQLQLSSSQHKEADNAFLKQENSRKETIIRTLQEKVRVLSRSLEEVKDFAEERSAGDSSKLKQLQMEMSNMKVFFQSRERQLEKENKTRYEILHEKELELVSKTDSLERQRKTVTELQRTLQNKQYESEKTLQNEKSSFKQRLEEQKNKIESLERELTKTEEDKRQLTRDLDQLKGTQIKMDYEKRLLSQQLDSLKVQFSEAKTFKQKFQESIRQSKSIYDQKAQLQRQLQRAIHSKESIITDITKQFQDQLQYQKRINRDLDQKVKSTSNKLLEVEGQLDLSRNQQDKIRRQLESSIKEATDAKEKEKSARKALRTKEQQMLSIETEQATVKQKLKNIDQIYKLEVDKHKQELDKMRIQLQNEQDKNQELHDQNNEISMQLNKVKIKLQYADQRSEKDNLNLRQKQNQVQSLIKDYEEQISGLDQTIATLRTSQKDLVNKLQKCQLDLIKSEKKSERFKKDLKVLEEKYSHSEDSLRGRTNQVQNLQVNKEVLQKKNADLQAQLNELKNAHLLLTNDRNKLSKMTELLEEDLKKTKTEVTSLKGQIVQKEKEIENLRVVIRQEKDENIKLDLKFSNFKKQIQRNKDTLFELIQKSLFTLPLGLQEDSRKNMDLLLTKKPVDNTFNEYFTMVTTHAKDIKQSLTRNIELIKQLERQKQRLQQEVASSSNKYQNTELTLKRQLEEMEIQMQKMLQEKQEEIEQHLLSLQDLREQIKEFQLVVEELNNQIEELNFTNNSLKMDYEVINEQNTKKITILKKNNQQLQQKLQYQEMLIAELEQRCSILDNNLALMQETVNNQNEAMTRKNALIEELKGANLNNQTIMEELKRSKKELLQKVSQLDLYLQTQKELNEKHKQLLAYEEVKANELKSFISNMMKQKQAAIKSDLERSETIITLEAELHELKKDFQLITEENTKYCKNLQTQRETNKKMMFTLKQLQNQRQEEKIKFSKLQQQLREKERQILSKDEDISKWEIRYQKTVQKLKSELKQLQEQSQTKNAFNMEQTKDTVDRIYQLQNKLQKKISQTTVLQVKLNQTQELLYAQRETVIKLEESLSSFKKQNQELKIKLQDLQSSLNEANDETRHKEEQLFDYSGKNYSLQMKLQAKQREYLQQMEYLNNEWSEKYDIMCEEYEQRLELVEKERDYFKGLGEEKDKEITKLNKTVRDNQSTESQTRKIYEDKLRKLEQEKLNILSAKNTEINRSSDEAKNQTQALKARQVELRRVTNELEVARKTINNLDQKSKDYDQKLKGLSKVYQTEIEQLKRRDVLFKSYKESVSNFLWNTEREIKKGLQHFIKNFLDISEDKNTQKVVDLAKGLEKGIMDTLTAKPVEK